MDARRRIVPPSTEARRRPFGTLVHRQKLLDLLTRYRGGAGITAEERPALERTIAFVTREPACFERSLVLGHVTGSAWILDSPRQRCLLTHHKKLGRWLQLGGHADGDPDLLRVALREAEEESGIAGMAPLDQEIFDLDVHPIPAGEEPAHLHYDVRFALVAPAGAVLVLSHESHALRWVPRSEVGRMETDDSVRRMAHKWSPRG